jgi:D-glycero-alpha-D-manno-heptose 1-phosphate guanylyltransferase
MASAIILAGGLGTRLRSTVPDLPKPMAPINGRPFLEHQMDYWIEQGVDHFVISVGYLKDTIINHFGQNYRGTSIDYAIEDNPLGTGGGLLLAVEKVKDDPVIVLNGDTFFEVNLSEMLSFHLSKSSSWTFALFRANESGRYMGMSLNENNAITSLKSGTEEVGRLANGGVYIINPVVLKQTRYKIGDKVSLEEGILAAIIEKNIALFGLEFNARFIDIGVPEDYKRASEMLVN